MDKSKFTFELVDTLAPDIVIKNALKQVEEVTEGYVSGVIDTYDGPIHNCTEKSGWAAAVSALQKHQRFPLIFETIWVNRGVKTIGLKYTYWRKH